MFKKLLILVSLLTTSAAFGKVKIEKLNFENNDVSKVVIHLNEKLTQSPELTVKDNIIQLEIPGSFVWPKIEKKVSWGSSQFDTTVTAYQYNKELVRFRVILPETMVRHAGQVSVTEEGRRLEVYFPSYQTVQARPKQSVKKERLAVKKEASLDDDAFLNQLIVQSKENKAEVVKTEKDSVAADKFFEDKVQNKQSAEQRIGNKDSFSFNEYVMKFIAFLGLILLGFYGVVLLMRKGVMKKGKLGFLNSTKMVEVLNTTYIAPKKSVIMLKAHNQVFLVGNSENGLQLISEISDVSGLIKEGEKQLSGSNFDTNMIEASNEDKEFNLKEVLTESEGVDANRVKASEEVKDKIRLSDQIKKKVQGLKPLQ